MAQSATALRERFSHQGPGDDSFGLFFNNPDDDDQDVLDTTYEVGRVAWWAASKLEERLNGTLSSRYPLRFGIVVGHSEEAEDDCDC